MPRWPNDESQYNTQSTFEGPQKSLILARNATARGAQKTSRLYIPNGLLDSQTSDTQWVEGLQPQTAKPLFLPEALIPDPDTVNLPSSPSALSASSKENDPTPSLPMGELHAEVDWLRRLAISYRAFASLYDERADRLLAANPEKMEQQQVVRTNHAPTRPLPEANESKQLKGKGVTMPVEGRQVTVKQGKTCHGDVESMLGGGHHSNWSDNSRSYVKSEYLFESFGTSLNDSKNPMLGYPQATTDSPVTKPLLPPFHMTPRPSSAKQAVPTLADVMNSKRPPTQSITKRAEKTSESSKRRRIDSDSD